MKDIIGNYFQNLQASISNLNLNEFYQVAELLKQARDRGKQVFIFGNGGSGATASHFACDINKGVSANGCPRFKVICLNDNLPTLLAYSNDLGYDVVFSEQLKNYVCEGDVVIGISGSGNSKNVLLAMNVAKERKAITIGITGFNGGKLKEAADYTVNAGIDDMQLSEDIHMIWVHVMMKCMLAHE